MGSSDGKNPLWIQILIWSLVLTIIGAGVGMILAPQGAFELVDETGIEGLYIKGTWIQIGSSKQLSITEGAITLLDGTFGIKSGEGWAYDDGTFKLTVTIEMGPFYEPCDTQSPDETDPADESNPPDEFPSCPFPCPTHCPQPCPCPPCPQPCPQPCPHPSKDCATIVARHSSKILYSGTVKRGETFTIEPEHGKEKLPSNIYVYICGKKVKIKVSCSKSHPIEEGMTFGGLLKVVDVDKIPYKHGKYKDGCKYGYKDGCNYGDNDEGCDCDDGYTYGCKYGYYGYKDSGYKDSCKYGYKCGCEYGSKYGCNYEDDDEGCACDYGYKYGCKCKGISSLTLKYIGKGCVSCGDDNDDGDDGCDVPSDCDNYESDGCPASNTYASEYSSEYSSETTELCEKYKTVTLYLEGNYQNLVTIQEIVGEVKQPVSGCCYVPTYVYKYTYQSDFSLSCLLNDEQYVTFSGTFTWR